MKKTLTAAAILITTMAQAQATRVLTELDIAYSSDGKTKDWYAPDAKACINMKSNTPVGILQNLNEWSLVLVRMKNKYTHVKRLEQEVLLPSYCTDLKDYSCVSMALRAESALVNVDDLFIANQDTMILTLKMDKEHVSVMLISR
jgi:hypothetical protein